MCTTHIAFTVNEAYFPYTCVAIQSIINVTKTGGGQTIIHIITGIQDNCDIFQRFSNIPHIQVEIHAVNMDALKDFDHSRFTAYAFLRFFLGDILPNVKRVLYLDADTLVLGDLTSLFSMDLQGNMLGMVEEYRQYGPNYLKEHGIAHKYYYNSGVILFDLGLWRKRNAQSLYWEFVKAHYSELHYPDQDAANILFQDDIFALPWEYNIMIQNIMSYDLYGSPEREKVYGALFHPKIAHFSASSPWVRDALPHPYTHQWRALAKQHNIPIRYERKQSLKSRFMFHLWQLYRFFVNRPLKTSIKALQRRYNRGS